MSPPPPLIDTSGRPFPLDRQLASGGEGAVYTLPNDPNRVAKVYHQHRPPSVQTIEKLASMVALANPQLLSLAAWPSGLLSNARTRQVAGFVMPRLIDFQPIQHLYNPVQRLKHFPRAGWTFQTRAARNLAAAFDEVHKTGCLVGDVNQSNAQVSMRALVRLIDCDSFQVRANGKQFLCEVGTPQYTPPELQGKSLRGQVRTENHDRFGLAVVLYQLLFVGRHPYAGIYRGAGDPSPEQLIAEFRFAQGPMARSWGMDPPPHTPTFADISPDIGALFRRAFERGSEAGNRPRPAEWIEALGKLEQSAVECAADTGHKYWRGANKCVWCRLADCGGPEYYFGVAGGAGTFTVEESRLQEVLRRLAACNTVEFRYERRRFSPGTAIVAEPLPDGFDDHHSTATVLSVATVLCALGIPFGLISGYILIVSLLGVAIFGTWLVSHITLSPWHREFRRRRTARNHSLADLAEIEKAWERKVLRYRGNHAELSEAVHGMIAATRSLAPEYQGELNRVTANAEALARMRHLRLHLIADADIPRIGAGRKQTLAAHSIFTAADIDDKTIQEIRGFGDALTSSLIAWRDDVLRQFRFNPGSVLSPADQRILTVRFRTRQQQMLAELGRQVASVEALVPACHKELNRLIPKLKEAAAAYQQAEADLAVLSASV